jgi:hypothetical protein
MEDTRDDASDDAGRDMVPTDGTTLTEVLAVHAEAGYRGQFEVESAASVRCLNCDASSPPDTLTMVGLRRLEGASDPDDMLGVYAVVCPACDAKGVLVLGFGPTAPHEEAEVGHALRDRRSFRSD